MEYFTRPSDRGQVIDVSYAFCDDTQRVYREIRDVSLTPITNDGSRDSVPVGDVLDWPDEWHFSAYVQSDPEGLPKAFSDIDEDSGLTPIQLDDSEGRPIWCAKDEAGGIWRPNDEARNEIDRAANPEAWAMHLAENEPGRGEWRS